MRTAGNHGWRPLSYSSLILLLAVGAGGGLGACSSSATPTAPKPRPSPTGTIILYTSIGQETVDAVVSTYVGHHPAVKINVFRAPPGEVNARIAGEENAGGIKADVIWASDPLATAGLESRGKLQKFTPVDAGAVPLRYRSSAAWGTRLLNVVIAAHRGAAPLPASWSDLAGAAFKGAVAVPNPAAEETVFGAFGFFATNPGYGLEFYRRLKANGATQVDTPEDVIAGVAKGRYKVGMTLETSAREAIATGSPIQVVWPAPGGISVYSPIAVFSASRNIASAEDFAGFVLTAEAQGKIAATGWQPIRPEIPGPPRPSGSREVAPDWTTLYGRRTDLLREYRSIFPG
jgi:iron(III) transport system substrate-binding protein